MGKITVKHYLDKRLKSQENSKDEIFIKASDGYYYPLYVQVICKRQNTKFKSYIKPLKKDTDFGVHKMDGVLDNTDHKELRLLIEEEKRSIQTMVSLLRPFENDGFQLAGFSAVYEKAVIDLKSLIGNHCKQTMNKLLLSSKLKDFGKVIDWDLDYQIIVKGLNKVVGSKVPGWQGLREKTEEINAVFDGYNQYVNKKTISFHEWLIGAHQIIFQKFLNRKRKSNFKKAGHVVEQITADYFEELVKLSTNNQWMTDNKFKFRKFVRNTINDL